MNRRPAHPLSPTLPPELEALVICHRASRGPTIRVWAGGDLGFSGKLAPHASLESSGPLETLAPTLREGDLAFANLETPLVPDRLPGDLFSAPPDAASRLAAAGFDLLHLANNHIRDFGGAGLAATRECLEAAGLRGLGAGSDEKTAKAPVILELQGLKMAWLGCGRTLQTQPAPGPVFWEYQPEELLEAVRETAPKVDGLAVSIHLGYMFVDYPHPDHRKLALDLAEAGAALVLCHHAHVLQGVEVTASGTVICHNLGNLLFDWTEGEVPSRQPVEPQRSGALFGFDLDTDGVAQAFALPIRVDDGLHLQWAEGTAGRRILDRLERISHFSDGSFEKKFWRQRAQRNTGQTLETLGRKLAQGNLGVLFEGARRFRPHHVGMLWRWAGGRWSRRGGAAKITTPGNPQTPEEESPPRVLMIGNFLSRQISTRAVCEELADRLSHEGWSVLRTSDRPARLPRLMGMQRSIWRFRDRFDVAQVDVFSGSAFFWAEAAAWSLQRLGKPFILTLHGGLLPEFSRRWPRRLRRLLGSAAVVTTPSAYLETELACHREDLCLLPNPLDLRRYSFRQRNPLSPHLMWLRAFHHTYNPLLAVEVIARLRDRFPEIRLKMIGPDKGDGSLQATRQRARQLGVDGNLEILGGIDKKEVPHYLDQGDIFLNTTNADNTPVSVMEAMASGLPVITTDVGGLRFLLDHDADALLVPPQDPDAMAEAVALVLRKPDKAAALAQAARAKVAAFDWDHVLPRWQSLLRQAAGTGDLR